MGRFDEMFERIERVGLYVVLIVLIIGQSIVSLFPSVGIPLDQSAGIALLSVVILFLFRYLDRNFKNLSACGPVRASNLLDAIAQTIAHRSNYKRVDILAHTSNVYYQGIQQNNVYVEHLRLLLRKMDTIDEMLLPEDDSDKERIMSRQQTQIEEWKTLKQSGKVGRLEIVFYPFEPMLHMMIVDGKSAVFGFYGLEHRFPGVSSATHDTFTLNRNSEESRLLVRNLEATFTQIWDEFNVWLTQSAI